MGNKGFTGPSSLLYHLRLPTAVRSVQPFATLEWLAEPERVVRHRHFGRRSSRPARAPSSTACRCSSTPTWPSCSCGPSKDDDFFYRNAQGDELVYVSEGAGVLESAFGELRLPRRRLRRHPARHPAPLALRDEAACACS